MTGLAGGFIGSWLFGHMGYAADGTGGGSGLGMILQILIIGLLIYFAIRLVPRPRPSAFRRRGIVPSRHRVRPGRRRLRQPRDRGRDINLGDADLNAFQQIHAAVQEAWSAGDLGRLRRLMTPEMLSYFSEELTRNASQGTQNIVANVELLKGDLSESWDEGDLQYATAYMRWRALDYVVPSRPFARRPGLPRQRRPAHPVEAEGSVDLRAPARRRLAALGHPAGLTAVPPRRLDRLGAMPNPALARGRRVDRLS